MDFTEKVEIQIDVPTTPVYNKYVKIQSLIPAHLHYMGKVTLTSYEWSQAGDVVNVSAEDADELLAKRYTINSCCGGSSDGKLFQLLDEV